MDEKTIARFWAKVDKRGPDECWLWTASTAKKGYGQFRMPSKMMSAHRASYSMFVGPLPHDKCVCHRCDVPSCVNPAHLFLGTVADNAADMRAKGRQWKPIGESNGSARLTESQVREIRSTGSAESAQRLAERFNVTKNMISLILLRKRWRHVE